MDFDAGNGGIERRRAQVDQAGGAGADQHDAAGDFLRVDLAGKHLPGRDIGARVVRPEVQPDAAVGIGRDLDLPDPDVVEAGLLAEGGLAAGVRPLEHVGAGLKGNPQRLGGQRRHVLATDAVDQRNPAHHLVAVGQPVDRADAGRGLVEDGQVDVGAGKGRNEILRVVADRGEAGLERRRRRWARAQRRGQDRSDSWRWCRRRPGHGSPCRRSAA